MSDLKFKLDGYDNIITILHQTPEDGYRKPVIAGFRKAALPVKNAMISHLPGNLKSLKKIFKIQPGKGKSMTLAVGAFGNQGKYQNSKGVMWDPYMLLYWHNYGTLANRSPEHNFQYNRRKKTANRRGGIKAGLFMEHAWEQSQGEAQKIFEKSYEEEHAKFLMKFANFK